MSKIILRGYADDSKPVIAWDNPLRDATIESTDVFEPGFAAAALSTYPTWEGPRIVGDDPWNVYCDLGAVHDIDYVALSAIEIIPETTLAMIIYESADGGVWDIVEAAIQLANATNLILFDKITTRYLRFAFSGIRYVGNVMAGEALRLERSIYVGHAPVNLNRQTVVTGSASENGQFLGRVVRSQMLTTSVDLQNVDADFMRQKLDPFFEAARTQPFYWAWRPADYQEVIYGWMNGDAKVTNQRANGMMQCSFDIRGRDR